MVEQNHFIEIDGTSWEGSKWDDTTFLKKYGNKPVVIRNFGRCFEEKSITKELLESLIKVEVLSVYTGDLFTNPTKEEFIEKFITDTPRFNLLEGLNPPNNQPELFGVPQMFQTNWYSGLSSPDPLVSMVCSTQLSYTKRHTDPAGSGAWMLLLLGEKRWTFTDPKYRSAIYSPLTRIWWDPNAPHQETKSNLPFCEAVPDFTIVHRAGDLLWVPPGYPHRVLTTKRAIGIGAFYMHPAIAVPSMESFLGDASYGLPDAYLGHPNLIELEEEKQEKKVDFVQSPINFTVSGSDYHFVRVLNNCWKKNQKVLSEFEEEIRQAEKRWENWKNHQNRDAHVYPEDAKAIYMDF